MKIKILSLFALQVLFCSSFYGQTSEAVVITENKKNKNKQPLLVVNGYEIKYSEYSKIKPI